MTQLGELVARGSRSNIYAWGTDCVAKVPLPETPDGWIRFEAIYTDAVYHCGVAVPRVFGLETIDGREASIFERVDGVSMWDALVRQPHEAPAFGRQLGELHGALLATRAPVTIPSQTARLRSKIATAARSIDPLAAEAIVLLPDESFPFVLCHGDFHPKNVMLSSNGPVIVDWFDASSGVPCGDVARTSLLLAGGRSLTKVAQHLPGASSAMLDDLHDHYIDSIRRVVSFSDEDFFAWRYVEAAARLAEGMDPQPLLDILAEESFFALCEKRKRA